AARGPRQVRAGAPSLPASAGEGDPWPVLPGVASTTPNGAGATRRRCRRGRPRMSRCRQTPAMSAHPMTRTEELYRPTHHTALPCPAWCGADQGRHPRSGWRPRPWRPTLTRFYDPTGQRFGIPTYPRGLAPAGLATRTQLRELGLRPGGQEPAAQLAWATRSRCGGARDGYRIAWLYYIHLARPVRPMTPAKERALA